MSPPPASESEFESEFESARVNPSPRFVAVVTAAALVPILLAIVRALTSDWIPVGDDGLLALRVNDVGGPQNPLLGSWTSASLSIGENVNNPGAWYGYLAAPFVAVLGPIAGSALAVGVLNGAALAGLALIGYRFVGPGVALGFVGAAAALSFAMGSELLVDLWQPHAMLLPVLLVCVSCAAVAAGRVTVLPVLMVVASIVVQTHLGHVYIVTFLVAASVVLGLWRRHSLGETPMVPLRVGIATSVGLVLAWLPAVVEQLRNGSDGNLARLVRNVGGGDVTVGLGQGLGIVAKVFVAPWSRTWFGDAIPDSPRGESTITIDTLPSAPLAVVILGVAAGALIVSRSYARRTRRTALAATVDVALATLVGSVLAVSVLTVGPVGFGSHHVRWTFAVGVFVWATMCWALLAWAGDVARRRSIRMVGPWVAALAVAVGFSAVNLAGFAQDLGPVGERWARPTLDSVAAQLDGVEVDGAVLFETATLRPFEPFAGTAMMLLLDEGVELRVDEEGWVRQLGDGRRADGAEIGRVFQLERSAALFHEGPECVLAEAHGGAPDDPARMTGLARQLATDILSRDLDLDLSKIPAADADVITSAVASGDTTGLERRLLDGAITGWARADAVQLTDAQQAADAEIGDWIRTVYGLYLDAPGPCPDQQV